MRKNSNSGPVKRVIDANINRFKEGLRVCEEISRFLLENPSITASLKKLRHAADSAIKRLPVRDLLKERDSDKDVGRKICVNELKRETCEDIFFANMQRAKESLRVLEEFSKLFNKKAALEFKEIRYSLYSAEKKIVQKIAGSGRIK